MKDTMVLKAVVIRAGISAHDLARKLEQALAFVTQHGKVLFAIEAGSEAESREFGAQLPLADYWIESVAWENDRLLICAVDKSRVPDGLLRNGMQIR
jgi:hypothetical protein